MAGSAAAEQTGPEADIVFGADRSGGSRVTPATKALPDMGADKKEENIRSPPEPEPKPHRVKGLPAGGNGATGKQNLHLGRLVSCSMCR